jgi:enoyl-[acyl-carrier-protein] reductase (NADH)
MASGKTVVIDGAAQDIVAVAVRAISGEVLHVDDGAHVSR